MSKSKNEKVLESISKENYLRLTPEAIVAAMLKQEVAGQRVFYVYLKQKGYGQITPESMDKYQSDGIVGNTIIECKLNDQEGGGPKRAYEELYETIPNRLKSKGERLPYFRIYVELETFLVEVYDCHCNKVEDFNWYSESDKFDKYFNDKQHPYAYDLLDDKVDLVEVIQNIYHAFPIKTKMDAYNKLEQGVLGWFNKLDIKNTDINRLILNNDKMNEKYVQKLEGAFFTPSRYVKISTKYVMEAIEDSEKDYDDYVVIDRCAGVGNLESQFEPHVYPHLILGTINQAEAFTANIRFNGLANVVTMDALSQQGVKHFQNEIETYKKKNNVKNLAVIFLENPPYAQLNSNKEGGVNYKQSANYIKTWVHSQMTNGGEDLDEQFVFSAFKYYNTYDYIHYGPVKIWKSRKLINKKVKNAYLCNRKHFNATTSAIALFHWNNKETEETDKEYNEIFFDSEIPGKFSVKKVKDTISELFSDDGKQNGICLVEARNFSFSTPRMTGSINSGDEYGTKWVSKDNLLKVLPLFCAARDEISEKGGIDGECDYRIIDTVYKSSDGGTAYQNDASFLQNCLLWTLCTHFNHCDSESKIWKFGESKLSKKHKETEIWKIYKELVSETGLNGLRNIEKYNKEGHGKLWKEHTLFPKVIAIKQLLRQFFKHEIRPKLLEYQLLK